MKRRDVIAGGLAATAVSVFPLANARAAPFGRARPGQAGWPSEIQWAELAKATGGRLSKPVVPAQLGDALIQFGRNPFYRGDTPGLTQSAGWLGAWRSEPSAYMVAAESAADVASVVRFAAAHNLRLFVKGGGHSYFGTSSAPDSLLIWTHKMNAVVVHDAFRPQGASAPVVPAISLGAGCIWLHAYQAAQSAGRYVQGGGCTTVGVGGLILGGGFGNFSKRYGLAAASLIETEVVTADGQVRVVNSARDPDLFWALKGGGGGTFGVVTRFTLATQDLPDRFGALDWVVRAHSDDAFRQLIAKFLEHYATTLFNPHWGEQARVTPERQLRLSMVFQGKTSAEAEAAFKPLVDYVASHPGDFETPKPLTAASIRASWFWRPWVYRIFARDAARFDDRPGANWGDFWWKGDGSNAGTFWSAYQSLWLPAALLEPAARASLADALFASSRKWTVSLHFNKGLAGAPAEVITAARYTPLNPDVSNAFALALLATSTPDEPAEGLHEMVQARERTQRVADAFEALRLIAPGAGSYFNECDYFLENWQQGQWGDHDPRLAEVKRRYGPKGLFFVHHGVGSEGWSADGFVRQA